MTYFCNPVKRFIDLTVWRGVRVVEGARLESVYRGNSIAGSNPALSASARPNLSAQASSGA